MLHTEFHGHQSISSAEEDFFSVFTINGQGGHLGHVTQLILYKFSFLLYHKFHIKFGFKWPYCFWEKQVLILKSEWSLAKVKEWPWPLISFNFINSFRWMLPQQLRLRAVIVSKNRFFPYKSLCKQLWPWRKMGQGWPWDKIWTILVVPIYIMLHTKFQGHW